MQQAIIMWPQQGLRRAVEGQKLGGGVTPCVFPNGATKQIAHRSRARNGAFSFAGGAGTWIGSPWSLLAVRVERRRTASTSAFSIALSRATSAVAISDLRK